MTISTSSGISTQADDTPLHLAAWSGLIETVQDLLKGEQKGNINSKGKYGFTPLFSAVLNRQKEMVELLLQEGADINALDDSGGTPLHLAAQVFAGKAMFQILLDKGADASVKNKAGRTFLDCIEDKETSESLSDYLDRNNRLSILVR